MGPSQTPALWHHLEVHVAGQRATRRRDLDRAGRGAAGDGGRDFGLRGHRETSRRAVKCDAGCARQFVSQDNDDRPHAASGRGFDKGTQTDVQTEHRAFTAGTAARRRPVGRLKHHANRIVSVRAVEAVQTPQQDCPGAIAIAQITEWSGL